MDVGSPPPSPCPTARRAAPFRHKEEWGNNPLLPRPRQSLTQGREVPWAPFPAVVCTGAVCPCGGVWDTHVAEEGRSESSGESP